ncbi:MAG: hypothetical protein CMJ89_06835 [Planctomycetes bacterium]|jgi:protein-disulfide isomerase/uncharacterized membrane protein|nr:hypothetical protein [Planctomycetota bacterium]
MRNTVKRFSWTVVLVLSLAGLLISGYLTQRNYALTEGVLLTPSFCAVNETIDCDRVSLSQYAVVFGYPLSSLGSAFYSVILWLAIALGFLKTYLSPEIRREVVNWIVALTLVALVVDVYLLGALIFDLKTMCLMCVATYLINASIFLLAWKGMRDDLAPATEKRAIIFWTGIMVAMAINVPLIKYWKSDATELALAAGPKQSIATTTGDENPQLDRAQLKERLLQALREQPELAHNSELHEGPSKGSSTAEYSITVFSDFECPYCRKAAELTSTLLLSEYRDLVRVVFKHYPLSSVCNPHVPSDMHKKACLFAAAANCANQGDMRKFWSMHDLIFEKGSALDEEDLVAEAGLMGLDEEEFAECLTSSAVRDQIARDVNLGHSIGVEAIPTVFINNRRLPDYRLLGPDYFGLLVEVLTELDE